MSGPKLLMYGWYALRNTQLSLLLCAHLIIPFPNTW